MVAGDSEKLQQDPPALKSGVSIPSASSMRTTLSSAMAASSEFELTRVGEPSAREFTPTELELAHLEHVNPELDPLQEAAILIRDALYFTTHVHPKPTARARKAHLLQLFLSPYVEYCLLGLVLLCFVELPPWCGAMTNCTDSLKNFHLTGNFSSGSPFIGDIGLPPERAQVPIPLNDDRNGTRGAPPRPSCRKPSLSCPRLLQAHPGGEEGGRGACPS